MFVYFKKQKTFDINFTEQYLYPFVTVSSFAPFQVIPHHNSKNCLGYIL